MTDQPDIMATQRDGRMTGKRKRFPRIQDVGSAVYDCENTVFRDNSRFVTEILVEQTNVLFTRPPQMGKTTLWSLAELLLGDTKTAPAGLESYPDETVKNSWYVVRIDFVNVTDVGDAPETEWEKRAKEVNMQIRTTVHDRVTHFLNRHDDLKKIFVSSLRDNGRAMKDLHAGQLVSELARAIDIGGKRNGNTKPTLLFLVDEYDKPIRDILLDFVGTNVLIPRKEVKKAFSQFVAFFNGIKGSQSDDVNVHAWVTGITPIGLTLISGFRFVDHTFEKDMADAVGLLECDVSNMLKEAIPNSSFDDTEQAEVLATLKLQFNNLGFPHGSRLFHTGMVNQAMARLQKSNNRQEWLEEIGKVEAEAVPASVFDVIARARNSRLRAVVSQLAERQTLTGYSISQKMSLASLLDEKDLQTDQYLTLLLHLGVVSVTYNDSNKAEFNSTSEVYRKKHLSALDLALASSIDDLLHFNTKQEMYSSGERILHEFLQALSETRMASLIAWAGSGATNKILELQLQGNIVADLHDTFKAVPESVVTTQEDRLKCGRSDVTIATSKCKVVLELKKKDISSEPTKREWEKYHSQLRSYVEEHRNTGTGSQWVAGFVLVMYNGGKNYVVQRLADDDTE